MALQKGDRVKLIAGVPNHISRPAVGQEGVVSYTGIGQVEVTWDKPTPAGSMFSTFYNSCSYCGYQNCTAALQVIANAVAQPVPVVGVGGSPFKVGDKIILNKDVPHSASPKAGWVGVVASVAGGDVRVTWTGRGLDTIFKAGLCSYCKVNDCRQFIQLAGAVAAPAAPASTVPQALPPRPSDPLKTKKDPASTLKLNYGDRIEVIRNVHGTTRDLKPGTFGWIVGFYGPYNYYVITDDGLGPYAGRNYWAVNDTQCALIAGAALYKRTVHNAMPIKAYKCDCGGHHSGFADFSNVGHSDWCQGHASKAPLKKAG